MKLLHQIHKLPIRSTSVVRNSSAAHHHRSQFGAPFDYLKHHSFSSTSTASKSSSPATSTAESQQQQQQQLPFKQRQRLLAQQYNNRRAKYKRAVTKLRHQYAIEIQKQTKLDEESKQKQQTIITRKRLERQRAKNIQSAKNAMRQEQFRLEQQAKFNLHLQQQSVKRKQREERFQKARQLVLNEMEQQSKYWMSTPQEIDAQLCKTQNHYIDQQLWTRPGSFIGEPTPSSDSQYWKYESHTWKIKSTYPLRRHKLLEEMEEMAYEHANVDYKVYWNDERIKYQMKLEQKAKLRALVLAEGKKALLLKQKQLMQDVHSEQKRINEEEGLLPPKMDIPVPSTDILANYDAMEREGVKVLQKDPTKFFVFANTDNQKTDSKSTDSTATSTNTTTDLGKPIRLVDPVRDGSYTNTPYPELIGRLPKPDLRTDREKKKQEREERMLAAAAAAASGTDNNKDDLEAEIEDELSFGGGVNEEDADYIKLANSPDEEDLEWEKGLDPITDKDILDTPYAERYTEEDIDWTVAKLEAKIASLKEIIALEDGNKDAFKEFDELEFESEGEKTDGDGDDDVLKAMGPGAVKSINIDEKGREIVSYDIVNNDDDNEASDAFNNDDHDEFDDLFSALHANELDDLIKIQDTENVLNTLTEEQIAALQSLGDSSQGYESKTADEIRAELSAVPGLTDDQLDSLVQLELALAKNEDVKRKLKTRK